MDVVLIDWAGNYREMAVTHTPVRIAKSRPTPWTIEELEDLTPIADVVDFRDSGLVDNTDRQILTPDGEMVPLGKFPRQVFRKGRSLWADVWLSELQLKTAKLSTDRLAQALAYDTFRGLVDDPSVLIVMGRVDRKETREEIQATRFRVFAGTRIPINNTVEKQEQING